MADKEKDGDVGDEEESSFVWDDQSCLYYHSRSGFYHDPSVGWYYNSHDGQYYRFEDGKYLPWNSVERSDVDLQSRASEFENPSQEDSGIKLGFISEGDHPPSSTSEWLEETLINLYLSGYANSPEDVGWSSALENDAEGICGGLGQIEEQRESCVEVLEEGEIGKSDEERESSGKVLEDNWLAQYGQVVKSDDEAALTLPVNDLWEWKLVEDNKKKRKKEKIKRLVGRLIKRTAKLHPSVSAGAGFLKTAPVSKINLDLVQVETGKIYRLRNPSAEYLSSLSNYDSSDPTKDWSFPRLDLEMLSSCSATTKSSKLIFLKDYSASSLRDNAAFVKIHTQEYRDRAAERRALHGSNNIGIGQKDSLSEDITMSPPAAEFGTSVMDKGSFGRRVLESMGWKEGEAIGKTNKGLLQPLQVEGNKGTAGLGWINERVAF